MERSLPAGTIAEVSALWVAEAPHYDLADDGQRGPSHLLRVISLAAVASSSRVRPAWRKPAPESTVRPSASGWLVA